MNEQDLSIPFSLEKLNNEDLPKISDKIKEIVRTIILRVLDIVVALLGILILIPLTLVVIINNIRANDYGPIFYTQDRVGKNGKIFKIYKFRTMIVDADKKLSKILLENGKLREEYNKYRKLKNDPRVTKIGEFLRKTSLDEFPQLINVLKGDMSLVGPRPYMPSEIEEMGLYYRYIIKFKPGLTGVYQISGRKRVEFLDRLDMDVRYYYNKSFITDLKILLITFLITLRRKNTLSVLNYITTTIKEVLTIFFKRVIDIIGALVGILLLIPLTAVVAIVNLINGDDGPIFYTHERIGKNGQHFKMYKFRSMIVNADKRLNELLEKDEDLKKEWDATRKLQNDPRITKIGKFLRKTSLDEFPQFINVLKGEMSLVGPRAVVEDEIDLFGKDKTLVLSVKPGITGYWAVNGRSETTYKQRIEMESYYVKNSSISLDINILLKTVLTVIKKEGAV